MVALSQMDDLSRALFMKNPLRHLVSMACVLLAASSAQAKDADAKERAAKIAIREVQKSAESLVVVFVCFDSETYALYNRLLAADGNESQ